MKITKPFIALIIVSMLANACTEPNGAPGRGIENGGALSKADVGVVAGVVTGGLVGSAFGGGTGNTLAIIGGGLLGGYMGHQIGASFDRIDQMNYEQASQKAMNTGHTQSWSNTDSGHHGTITPHKKYVNEDGKTCREYNQTIIVEGQPHKAYGTACKDDDGTWRIVE